MREFKLLTILHDGGVIKENDMNRKQHNYPTRFYKSYNQFVKNDRRGTYPTLMSKIIACHIFTKLNWDKKIYSWDEIKKIFEQ